MNKNRQKLTDIKQNGTKGHSSPSRNIGHKTVNVARVAELISGGKKTKMNTGVFSIASAKPGKFVLMWRAWRRLTVVLSNGDGHSLTSRCGSTNEELPWACSSFCLSVLSRRQRGQNQCVWEPQLSHSR